IAQKWSPVHQMDQEDHGVMAIAAMPMTYDVHPKFHYQSVGSIGTAWIGSHRHLSYRQMVVIQKVYQTTISDIKKFAQIAHLNIARPIAFYSTGKETYVAYEFIELDLFDLRPLSEVEVAGIASQILDAVVYLIQHHIGFRISMIRVSVKGRIKIGKYH
ncbi:hypothetical protein M441DRAFT_141957, partial [Trichoderma asperellum CBS 433.97]